MNERAQMRGIIGVLAIVAGACLSVAGTFLELYHVAYDFGEGVDTRGPTFQIAYTSWVSQVTPRSENAPFAEPDVPQYGAPVVFGAILLVVCAAVLLRAPRRSPRVLAVAGFTSVGAAMLLVGAVWSVGQYIWSQVSESRPGIPIKGFVGTGLWVLVVGAGVALVGSLLVQRLPERAPLPTGPLVYQLEDDEFADLDTPPLGFEAPVVATLPTLETHHPTGVDPSTVEPRPN